MEGRALLAAGQRGLEGTGQGRTAYALLSITGRLLHHALQQCGVHGVLQHACCGVRAQRAIPDGLLAVLLLHLGVAQCSVIALHVPWDRKALTCSIDPCSDALVLCLLQVCSDEAGAGGSVSVRCPNTESYDMPVATPGRARIPQQGRSPGHLDSSFIRVEGAMTR